MSTFSGLGTALSSLIAQRQALEVSGQNVANSNTVGYTRQRATLSSLPAASVPSMFSVSSGTGEGARVTGIERLGDAFLDARLRTQTGGAAYLAERAEQYSTLESTVGEPGTGGLSTQLSTMWGGWADLGNTPDKGSAGEVLLEDSRAVANRLKALYTSAQTQWTHARTTAVALVDQVNTAAAGVADLNERILTITNAGGTAHELADQRDLLATKLASLVGATVAPRDNGQLDVIVGGNSLVAGIRVHELAVSGPTNFGQAVGDKFAVPPVVGQAVGVVWANRPTLSAGLDGGRVAGLLSVLAPPDAAGTGGLITEAATRYDELADSIATQVNGLHTAAFTSTGAAGGKFFTFGPGSRASGLTVAITDTADIAIRGSLAAGALDSSVADKLADLGTQTGGPDWVWSATVVELGVRTSSAATRASVSEAARSTAEKQQLSAISVDTDEEAVNMLAFQRAYEGAARVLTAVDQMLDTLINRTGLVGR